MILEKQSHDIPKAFRLCIVVGCQEEARSKGYVADLGFKNITLQSDEAIRETEPENGHPKKKSY